MNYIFKLETALRSDGFTEKEILDSRDEWRRIAFTTDTRDKYMTPQGKNSNLPDSNIQDSKPYKRILNGLQNGTIRPYQTSTILFGVEIF